MASFPEPVMNQRGAQVEKAVDIEAQERAQLVRLVQGGLALEYLRRREIVAAIDRAELPQLLARRLQRIVAQDVASAAGAANFGRDPLGFVPAVPVGDDGMAAAGGDDLRRHLAKAARAADDERSLAGERAVPQRAAISRPCRVATAGPAGQRRPAGRRCRSPATSICSERNRASTLLDRIGEGAFLAGVRGAIDVETGKQRVQSRARHADDLRRRQQRLDGRRADRVGERGKVRADVAIAGRNRAGLIGELLEAEIGRL